MRILKRSSIESSHRIAVSTQGHPLEAPREASGEMLRESTTQGNRIKILHSYCSRRRHVQPVRM